MALVPTLALRADDGAPHDGASLDFGAFEEDAAFDHGPLAHTRSRCPARSARLSWRGSRSCTPRR